MFRLFIALSASVVVAATACAQTVPPGATTSPPATVPATPVTGADGRKTGVLVPPTSVDPGIAKATPNPGAFPTPTVTPPAAGGGSGPIAK